MATKKTTDLSGLVATKGTGAPVVEMASRFSKDKVEGNTEPLNFRVPAEFRRRFRTYAAAHDLKQHELLRLAFDEYENRRRGR